MPIWNAGLWDKKFISYNKEGYEQFAKIKHLAYAMEM